MTAYGKGESCGSGWIGAKVELARVGNAGHGGTAGQQEIHRQNKPFMVSERTIYEAI
jgi:hypothetical protein